MKRVFKYAMLVTLLFIIAGVLINVYMVVSTRQRIYSQFAGVVMSGSDCIMVLGAGVSGDRPSLILRDRLARGHQLYVAQAAPKLLLTGDHHQKSYNEVQVMKDYMLSKSVDGEALFMDHAGLSTYESMIRALDVFGVRRMIVVTQRFHMSRALYLAECVGIDAIGVETVADNYPGANFRQNREYLARIKDFFVGLIKPQTYIAGSPIDIHGDGTVTQD